MQLDFRVDLNLDTLALDSGYSRTHFLRMFRAATGKTPREYLLALRLAHARRRLKETVAGPSEIALESGFSSHSHLTTLFRRHIGMTASLCCAASSTFLEECAHPESGVALSLLSSS
jgi:AraC family transcriptional regulator